MRKLSQTEYGFTASGSLANGGLYVDDDGRVFFLTDAEAHRGITPAQEKATRAVLATDGWDPAPLDPCGSRATIRGRKAEEIAANVLAAMEKPA